MMSLRTFRLARCHVELVDGVLVEKAKGLRVIAGNMAGGCIDSFRRSTKFRNRNRRRRDVSLVPGIGADTRCRLHIMGSATRPPNPNGPRAANSARILAVEVVSRSNTEAEMERKLDDYFHSGVRLVWIADPETRTVRVHTSRNQKTVLGENDTLDGGDVLPGLSISVREWFGELDRQG